MWSGKYFKLLFYQRALIASGFDDNLQVVKLCQSNTMQTPYNYINLTTMVNIICIIIYFSKHFLFEYIALLLYFGRFVAKKEE